MGYTHYWRKKPEQHSPEKWASCLARLEKIINESPIPLGDWDGKGKPEISPERIAFNGEEGNDCETFSIYRDMDKNEVFEFCKTNHYPYDVVVTACLVVLSNDMGFQVSSDGGKEEWKDGVALASKILNETLKMPLSQGFGR